MDSTSTVSTDGERIAYREFFYTKNNAGKFQLYGQDGAEIEGAIYRNEAIARAAIDTRISRAEALAEEHAEHAAREAKRAERAGTLTPAEAIRELMGRRENRADDLI